MFATRSLFRSWGITMLLGVLLPAGLLRADGVSLVAGLELSQIYKPGVWQPVHLELRNDTDRLVAGSAVLPLTDPHAPAVMTLPVSVPPRSSLTTTIWGSFPAPAPQNKRQPNQVPPLGVVQWRSSDGQLLARAQILGFPISNQPGDDPTSSPGQIILLVQQRSDLDDPAYDVQAVVTSLSKAGDLPLTIASVSLERLPRQPVGLHAVKVIMLDGIGEEDLDPGQRRTLMQYLREGGTVVIPAPDPDLARWPSILPVHLIGKRLAQNIETTPHGPVLKFYQPHAIVEAVASAGQALCADADYVHVAVRSIGLGKVVFTSFPANSLDDSQPQVAKLWRGLLDLDTTQLDSSHWQIAQARFPILTSMIGKKVAPWRLAATLAIGYFFVVLAVQLVRRGAVRPQAFAASAGIAVLLSATLLLMGMTRRSEQLLQSARLAILDVSADGGGMEQQSLALVGRDVPDMTLNSPNQDAMVRPASSAGAPPTVQQAPFAVRNASVATTRIDQVWEATAPLDPSLSLRAAAHLGPGGLELVVDNGLDQTVHNPIVVWNRRALSCADLPPGHSSIAVFHLNDRNVFTNGALVPSDQDKRRGQVIQACLTPASESVTLKDIELPPLLYGWLPDAPHPLLESTAAESADQRSMVMVRTPLSIERATARKISVPAALVALDPDRFPYEVQAAASVPSQDTGQWLIGFAAPASIGPLQPTHAAFEARLVLPAHTLMLRKGQCAGGRPTPNPDGQVVAEWGRQLSSQQVSFDCGPGDYDAQGRIWLLLDIQSADSSAASTPWQMKDMQMGIDADAPVTPGERP